MKKNYVTPNVMLVSLNEELLLNATSTYDGHGSVDPIEKDDREEGGWAGSKEHGIFDLWEEE